MASQSDIDKAFRQAGRGSPSSSDYSFYSNWADAGRVEGDLRAGGNGVSGGGPGGSSSGGGSSGQISAPDLAKLSLQAAGIVHPYYAELAKQAKGNFDEAVRLMQGDYTAGVKKAKEDNALAVKYGSGDLNNALDQLGLSFAKENDSNISKLNERGAAVYQNNPDGTPSVVTPGTFNPSFDPNTFNYNAGVSGTNPNINNLGRGGYEAEQARKDQSLRAEATMRAGMKPLEQAGITLKQTTNTPAGFNPNDPLNKNVDLSQAGSLERNLAGSYQPKKESYLSTLGQQKQQENQSINNIASTYGNTQQKAIDQNAQDQLNKQYNTDFLQSGLT